MVTNAANDPGPGELPGGRDRLTGLEGLAGARARLERWRDEAGEGPAPVQAMLIGLRRFDAVNLAYGADAGDAALVEVAGRLLHFAAAEIEGEWLVARLGGGTFLFAANEASSRERWQSLAEMLAAAIARPLGNISAGSAMRLWPRIALMRAKGRYEPQKLIGALAHTLEGLGQHEGRRIGWVDGDDVPQGRGVAQLEGDLLAALERKEISVLFQPQFDCRTGRIVGAEALARWEHPELGRLGAEALFGIATRADQTAQLSNHIAREALSLAADWPEGLRLSLNITPADLSTVGYVAEMIGLIDASGVPADCITLEITEQALLGDLERAADLLRRFSDRGLAIALDDFGAGFCNFRYLKILPLDYLKLDRTMVEGVSDNSRDLAVLRGIVTMAHSLGLKVIVEGIEREDQRAVIAAEGCEFYQGFLGAKPMEAKEFLRLASAR